ncbi:hypothetical protein pb186bvf_019428 [Paramecium bursaria]
MNYQSLFNWPVLLPEEGGYYFVDYLLPLSIVGYNFLYQGVYRTDYLESLQRRDEFSFSIYTDSYYDIFIGFLIGYFQIIGSFLFYIVELLFVLDALVF